mmetsp:Transcript_88654/g.259118  ORF Transcript_88654/g.259118 Transcript_88654/m.259118 type:complete len:203 (-) Transcript_88654:484-1092(-)
MCGSRRAGRTVRPPGAPADLRAPRRRATFREPPLDPRLVRHAAPPTRAAGHIRPVSDRGRGGCSRCHRGDRESGRPQDAEDIPQRRRQEHGVHRRDRRRHGRELVVHGEVVETAARLRAALHAVPPLDHPAGHREARQRQCVGRHEVRCHLREGAEGAPRIHVQRVRLHALPGARPRGRILHRQLQMPDVWGVERRVLRHER